MTETKICDACGRMLCNNRKNGTISKNLGTETNLKNETILCHFCIEAVLLFIDKIRVDNKERFAKLDEILLPPDDRFKI